ncbi:sporulation peptidase YabG [Paenibacillus pasadenensis]|uniref:sporulation peptidase YabG n=1 Tax=Paenibacillus pasadenensis TaxID=217090 RepID=UPI00203B3A05|nr:sporulation peptidase YabG [Paenibacillus pasadenensis]MCM3750031.1 sporulation peptidase YabG [Paenibacillus pasadenensis]
MKQGDYVVRRSYGRDVVFRVEAIHGDIAILKGSDYRLLADAPLGDLEKVSNPEELSVTQSVRSKVKASTQRISAELSDHSFLNELEYRPEESNSSHSYFDLPGKVLHLDGDANYMRKSMQLYNQMKVPAQGLHVAENQMADLLYHLLPQVRPDIVVITGHDGLLKTRRSELYSIGSYKNSQNFVNAVQIARDYDKNRDNLVVVAGACQSYYEALLQAGSNFASSPGRILIHALDPVYIAIKASYTSIRECVNLPDIIHGTISGIEGVGGIETMGRYRVGLPKPIEVKKVNPNPYYAYGQ